MKLKTHLYSFLLSELSSQVDNLNYQHNGVLVRSVDQPYIFDGPPPAHPREVITIRPIIFPANLFIRRSRGVYVPIRSSRIPTIVNSVGFAVAILQNTNVIRGIYNRNRHRVKVDTLNNVFSIMNPIEIMKYPVDVEFHNPGSIVSFVPEGHQNH